MNPMPELIPMLKQLRLSGILDSRPLHNPFLFHSCLGDRLLIVP